MKLSQFRFVLPKELIAHTPYENRDDSRLMVLNRKKHSIEHKKFTDIIDYFDEGDLFVLNNTKVFPARLWSEKEKTGAKIEVFLLRELNRECFLWDVLVDPARKIRIGNKLYFGDNDELVAEVIDNTTSRGRTLRFLFDGRHENFKKKVLGMGDMPLPDCILRIRDVTPEDKKHYQTIYAKHEGAVVAPYAGLHFNKMLIKRLELKGITFADVTLHVGVGNFKPIDVEDLGKHKIDSEQFIVSEEVATTINSARAKGNKICAVGTTSLKALESSAYNAGLIKSNDGWTNKFIFPPYEITSTDALITNFHASQSTMLMLVCAFGGYDLVMEAYKKAVEEQYRFLTFGDAMLIV